MSKDRKTTELEEGWEYMQNGISKLKGILDGSLEQFSSEEYMMLYTYIFFAFLLNVVLMNWLEDSCNFSNLSLIFNTSELSTICVLRSHPMTILSSFMTSTGRRFKYI